MIRVVVGLLAVLLACVSSAVAQAPSESTWRSLTTTGWVEVCVAPCRVANPSSYVVRLTVGSATPSSSDVPAIDLTSDYPPRDFGVIGTRVYGRAADRATRVVVEPLSGSGGGGGGSANPYPSSDYATSGRQDTTIAALGAPADAEAQTGNGSVIAISKGQRAILSNLLASYGAVADAAAASGNGSMIALTKALRDKVATAANQATANASLASIDGKLPALVSGRVPVDTGSPAANRTTDGALEPPTCPAGVGRCPPWFASISANTSTQLVGANTGRIGVSIQCTGSAPIAVSETGATLTTATPAANSGISLVIPSGSFPYFAPQIASRSLITAYTGTAQSCWGTEYLR